MYVGDPDSLKKWQYKLVTGPAEEIEKLINEAAAYDWEPIWLTAVPEGLACMLKKKKEAQATGMSQRGPWHRAA